MDKKSQHVVKNLSKKSGTKNLNKKSQTVFKIWAPTKKSGYHPSPNANPRHIPHQPPSNTPPNTIRHRTVKTVRSNPKTPHSNDANPQRADKCRHAPPAKTRSAFEPATECQAGVTR